MVNHVIIMAGGAGKRLWPASNSKQPKQLMPLTDGDTLLINTIRRAFALGIDGKVIIVTHFSQVKGCLEELSKLSENERKKIVILGEPVARNTAPALSLAARWIELNENPTDRVLVLAADHLIEPQDAFNENVKYASQEADKGNLVTFGIKPSYPSTGYGYIEVSAKNDPIRKVLSFKEKPNQETAESFLVKGNFFWNSGMFAYRVDQFQKEMKNYSPDVYQTFHPLIKEDYFMDSQMNAQVSTPTDNLTAVYGKAPSISIDYALMEKSQTISMVASTFSWNDIGSWDEIAKEELTPIGETFGNVDGNYIYSDLPVAIAGVKDLIVVVKNGSVMICPKGQSQLVKSLVEEIENKDRSDLL